MKTLKKIIAQLKEYRTGPTVTKMRPGITQKPEQPTVEELGITTIEIHFDPNKFTQEQAISTVVEEMGVPGTSLEVFKVTYPERYSVSPLVRIWGNLALKEEYESLLKKHPRKLDSVTLMDGLIVSRSRAQWTYEQFQESREEVKLEVWEEIVEDTAEKYNLDYNKLREYVFIVQMESSGAGKHSVHHTLEVWAEGKPEDFAEFVEQLLEDQRNEPGGLSELV
jgi:hypothetical protein